MKVLCFVQARMSSRRLPGKVMHVICGKPMIEHILNSLAFAKAISDTVVVTTTNPKDDELANFLEKKQFKYFRGEECDVLSRFTNALRVYPADYIVRITADNPLTDPELVDRTVGLAISRGCDYVSNHLKKTFPLGYVVEVISAKTLLKIERITRNPNDREHVTLYVHKNPDKFSCENLLALQNLIYPHWRLTVDTMEDLELMQHIFKSLYRKNSYIKYSDVVRFLLENPDLLQINSKVQQKHPD